MCEPVTIGALTITTTQMVMAGIAVASAAASAVAARRNAKAQMKAQHEQRQAQAEEIHAAKSAELGERVKQGRAERARLRVAGGEAGIAGNSFEAQLMDSFFQEDFDNGLIVKDAFFAQRGSEARYQSSLASIHNPSALETGLNIAGAAVSGYKAGTLPSNPSGLSGSPLTIGNDFSPTAVSGNFTPSAVGFA